MSSNATVRFKVDGGKYALQKASISLNDCLACSGCITSAETILISEHSSSAFSDFLLRNETEQVTNRSIIVVTLSPQSIVNLLAHTSHIPDSKLAKCFNYFKTKYSPPKPDADTFRTFITSCFLSMGVHLVTDVTWARDICLYEAGSEFIKHSIKHNGCTETMPLFSSICPGWICYAEKGSGSSVNSTSNEFSILPYISRIRSPQQIAGKIIKLLGEEKCFHVSIMPCFDKKLEASRDEFSVQSNISNSRIPDVDLVLATNELLCLLESFCHEFEGAVHFSPSTHITEISESHKVILSRLCKVFRVKLPEQQNICNKLDSMTFVDENILPMYRHNGSGSGGYAAYIFRIAAKELFSINLNCNIIEDEHVIIRQLQNRDLQELLLFNTKEDRNMAASQLSSVSNRIPYRHLTILPKPLLAFVIANGFRNIQTVVQYLRKMYQVIKFDRQDQTKFKAMKSLYPFDYVEVMACPNGCLNGGGQIKEVFTQTNEMYTNLSVCEPMSNDLVQDLYAIVKSKDANLECLRTSYRNIPKIEIINPSALKW
ncbi:unnamed protein product [Heterobilharzia americana]|nr:unnamed protein product [Heterobilharzia americana]